MSLDHPSGARSTEIESPWTRENVKCVLHKSYNALQSSIVQSPRTSDKVLEEVTRACRIEMKFICSLEHNSIL